MRVYVSGPLSLGGTLGHDEITANVQRMRAAERRIAEAGHEVISPLDCDHRPDSTWADYMRADIAVLVTCDAICLLPGAEESRGAQLEAHIARELGLAFVSPP